MASRNSCPKSSLAAGFAPSTGLFAPPDRAARDRFLRDVLYRDEEVESDVLLQTGKPGISQESTEVLFEFPTVAAELFEYDCIVAFDPDWQALDELQVRLLDRWVSEKAGGLILVAGPVFTPEWTRLRRGVDRRGWLPTVDLRAGGDLVRGRRRDFDQSFVSGGLRDLFDEEFDRGTDVGVSLVFSWDLGDTLFHPDAIDVSREARAVGRYAVQVATTGEAPHGSVVIQRKPGATYDSACALAKLEQLAQKTRTMDASFLKGHNDIDPSFVDYLAPLVAPLPQLGRLKRDLVAEARTVASS